MKTIFAKYNSERLPKYQIVTKIVVANDGKKYALKEPLCDEAKEHIEDIYNNYELLSSTYDINLVKPTKTEDGMLFEIAEGRSLELILLDAIAKNDDALFQKYMNKFLDFVEGMVSERNILFHPSKEFQGVFGSWNIDEPQDIIKVTNIDLIFGNIFVDEEDHFTLIDYEWVFDFEMPKSYVVWRSLAIFSVYHSVSIDKFSDLYFTNNDCFSSLDDNFSSFVHGKNKKYFLAPKVRKAIHFINLEKKETINSEHFIQFFIDKSDGFSEENSIKLPIAQNTELQEFTFDLTDQQKIKALRLDPLNECCVIEIERLHLKKENELIDLLPYIHSNAEIHYGKSYFFTTENPQIYFNRIEPRIFENASSYIVVLKYAHISKDALQISVKQKNEDLAVKESKIQSLNEDLAVKESKIQSLNQDLEHKHTQLMQMSDWAQGMKLRLEKIDSSIICKKIEKYLVKKISLKNIVKTILPKAIVDKYRFKKIKINFNELYNSVQVNQKIIVAFPIITWGFRYQRPQHLLKELTKKGYTVIYIAMSITPKRHLFNSMEDAGLNINFTKLDENIYKIWIHSYDDINIYTDHISDENLQNMSLSMQSALKMLETKDITYMVQFPGWSRLVFDLKSKFGGKVVFDCMDDHSGFSTNTQESLKEEHMLIKKSDLVLSSSQLLFDKNNEINIKNIQIKNGTEFEHFNKAERNGKLEYLSDKPIIGYYGAISDWFDMEIVEYCAKKHNEYNFVMIGSTCGCDISKAKKIKNIHFLGEIPYKELPGYFAYFDVCLIPFKLIPLTLATNPVKFYEYISAGKPVVSIRLPELVPYSEYCYLVDNKEEFLEKIDEALYENNDKIKTKRIELAKDNSWSQRAEMIYKGIQNK